MQKEIGLFSGRSNDEGKGVGLRGVEVKEERGLVRGKLSKRGKEV